MKKSQFVAMAISVCLFSGTGAFASQSYNYQDIDLNQLGTGTANTFNTNSSKIGAAPSDSGTKIQISSPASFQKDLNSQKIDQIQLEKTVTFDISGDPQTSVHVSHIKGFKIHSVEKGMWVNLMDLVINGQDTDGLYNATITAGKMGVTKVVEAKLPAKAFEPISGIIKESNRLAGTGADSSVAVKTQPTADEQTPPVVQTPVVIQTPAPVQTPVVIQTPVEVQAPVIEAPVTVQPTLATQQPMEREEGQIILPPSARVVIRTQIQQTPATTTTVTTFTRSAPDEVRTVISPLGTDTQTDIQTSSSPAAGVQPQPQYVLPAINTVQPAQIQVSQPSAATRVKKHDDDDDDNDDDDDDDKKDDHKKKEDDHLIRHTLIKVIKTIHRDDD